MRIFWIGIAVCLSVGQVQGMEKKEEVAGAELRVLRFEDSTEVAMREARHVVRSVVRETLKRHVKLGSVASQEWEVFKWKIRSQEFNNTLNNSILTYLKTGEAPDPAEYLGCKHSFEGVREALIQAGVEIDEQDQNKLRLLTPKEKHKKIIMGVRAMVIATVYKNVRVYKDRLITEEKNEEEKLKIDEEFRRFFDKIQAESCRKKLNRDIIIYLRSNIDPCYFNYKFSFKGIKEDLKKDGIVLDNQTDTLRFLTEREKRIQNKECQRLIDEFEEL